MTEAIPATARWQSCAIVGIATRTRAIKSFFLRLSETFDYTAEPEPVALLLASRTYKSRSSFPRAFRQVHGYIPAESEDNGQNSD